MAISIVILLLNSGFAYAALEIRDYPTIPGLISPSACTGRDCLSVFIAYWFGLLIYLAGALALISFTIGAVSLIASAENPSARGEAIDRIKGAILGLVLTIASFVIIHTINPTLITPALAPLPGVDGVFYTNGSENKPAPIAEADTANIPAGYNRLVYICNSGPALLVWQFPKTDFRDEDDYPNTNVQRLECNKGGITVSGGSFRMAFETPGVYYYLKESCSGFMSDVNLSSGQLEAPFKDKVKSIKIINNIPNNVRYVAIFHDNDDNTKAGPCTAPLLINDINKSDACLAGIPVSSSVDIFNWNAKTPETSGQGVDFYSEPWGQSIGARAGKYSLDKSVIKNYWNDSAQKLTFDYTKVNRPDKYKQLYPNFSQHPGSININGSYLAVLNASSGQERYCQVFSKSINNLNEIEFIATKNKIDTINILPIK